MVMDRQGLFNHLSTVLGFSSKEIQEAFKATDRADFVSPEFQEWAYLDTALPIGFSATISQPYTVLFMFNLLRPQPGNKILDVGAGSGWTTAMLGRIAGSKGEVYGTEKISALVKFSRKNLDKYKLANIKLSVAGKKLGLSAKAPFDKILVSAAADSLPSGLVSQLRVGGRMVIPIDQSICRIDKVSDTKIIFKEYPGFSFVPLR